MSFKKIISLIKCVVSVKYVSARVSTLRLKYLVSFFLFLSLEVPLMAQQAGSDLQDQLEDFIEENFSDDESVNIEQLMAELHQKLRDPYNINQVTTEDLSSLYILSQSQINNILDYREKYGPVLSVYELMAVPGMDRKTIELLSNFIVFEEQEEEVKSSYVENDLMLRGIRLVEKQAGFIDPKKYEGSPDKLYLRYRFTSSTIYAGLTAEKDPGESFFQKSNPKGFDYYSGFLSYNLGNGNPKVYLGDFVVQFGQGLAISQGFSMGKSSETVQVAKLNPGVKEYSSTDENNYMRGIAATTEFGKLRITPFLSFKNFDANTDSIDGMKVFTSFQTSGYHRTASEIEDKNSVSEFIYGANLNYEGKNYSIGLTGIRFNYQYPLNRRDAAYNENLFEGDHIENLSVDYKWAIRDAFVFGEFSGSPNNGFASLNGLLFQPVDRVDLSVIYRNINKKYNAPLASAFTETSRVNDEKGLYVGAKVYPLPKFDIDLYADFFKWNWIKYTTAAPGKGHEYLIKANYKPNENWESYFRYKYEIKPVKTTIDDEKLNVDQVKQSFRFNLKGNLGSGFVLKTRAEFSLYKHDHCSSGFFIGQDFGFQPEEKELSIWARLAWFKTDDCDSRIYAYENDMLYQFSIPAFYGEGLRYYLTGKVKICEKTHLWFKASRSWLYNEESISSGYSKIDGNKRTEVKIQLRFRF